MELDCGHKSDTGYLLYIDDKVVLYCFLCKLIRIYYKGKHTRRKRRTHDEVVLERDKKNRIKQEKKEFHRIRKARRKK